MNDDLSANPLVLDHFLNPRNVGDLPEADGVGEAGAVSCGDVVRIGIRVRDGRIAEARFRTYGCGTAIAPGFPLSCPDCALPARLRQGDEIVLERIEMEVA